MFKKKVLLQIRDPKTLMVELFFPLLLIIMGTGLASVKFFYDGAPRMMSPTIFPSPNPLVVNTNPLRGDDPSEFVQDYLVGKNASEWKIAEKIQLTGQDIDAQLSEYSKYLFDNQERLGGSYGNYYFYDFNNAGKYSAVAFANVTSQDAVAVFGMSILQNLARYALNQPNFSFEVINQPFPLTLKEKSILTAAAGVTQALLYAIAFMMIADSLIQNIIREREKNVKHQMIVSGASVSAYWAAHYCFDVIWQIFPCATALICQQIFNVDIP